MTVQSEDLGTLDQTGAVPVVRYERRLGHPRERVWAALTEPDQLAHWFPTTIEGERVPGAALTFSFEHIEIDPMHGEMLRYEPPSVLEFTWGGDRLRFELREDGESGAAGEAGEAGTVLLFTVALEELGKAARDGAGWHVRLENLAAGLGGEPIARADTSPRWREVHPGYVARFGREASTLGPPQEWEDKYGEA